MGRYRVVDHRRNAMAGQELMQCIAIHTFQQQGVLVEYMIGIRRPVRDSELWVTGKCLVVMISCLAAGRNVFIEIWQFYIQYSGLQGIEPAVAANAVVVIAFGLTVVGDHFQRYGQFIIIGEDSAAIAIAT